MPPGEHSFSLWSPTRDCPYFPMIHPSNYSKRSLKIPVPATHLNRALIVSCQITCIAFGDYLREIATTPSAGRRSKPAFRSSIRIYPVWKGPFLNQELENGKGVYGNAGSGSIPYKMMKTSPGISITSILIRSSMDWWISRKIGLGQVIMIIRIMGIIMEIGGIACQKISKYWGVWNEDWDCWALVCIGGVKNKQWIVIGWAGEQRHGWWTEAHPTYFSCRSPDRSRAREELTTV